MSDPTAVVTRNDTPTWTGDEALTVFKMYEDKGWAVKQQMLAMFGLFTPIVFGLLAVCAKEYLLAEHLPKPVQISTTAEVAGWTAAALSLLMLGLIILSLLHANRDYTRSHHVLDHIRAKQLLPNEVVAIIQDPCARQRSSLWHDYFGFIGWQFLTIMGFSVVLTAISLAIASWLSL